MALWSYHPKFVADPKGELHDALRAELEPLTVPHYSRRSCLFSLKGNITYNSGIPPRRWDESPLIMLLKKLVETYCGREVDYCLAHIYTDGSATIGWHNDSEALKSDVLSLSFGAPRKFRFRKIGTTKGWEHEQVLGNGDLFHMHRGCQEVYEHCVPVETKIKGSRINLTFRFFEK